MNYKEENVEEISDNWKRLKEAIPDIEQFILEDKIKVIRLKEGMKEPLDNDYYFKEVQLEELKKHKGNYGIIAGYNNKKNGFSIAVADVDGLTIKEKKHNIPIERKEEIKQATKEFIYNTLKEALPNALAVRTQSNGYHFYLWNEEEVNNFHEVSKNISFPSDFKIEELRNKSLEHSIEIFTKFKSKYIVLPTAIITKLEDKKNKKIIQLEEEREYTILSEVTKLSEIGSVNNIHETIKESLLANNYGVAEKSSSSRKRKSRSKKTGSKNNSSEDLKKLSKFEVNKVVKLITDKYKLFSVIDGSKHEGALALGGYFNKHITKGSSRRIASGIVNNVPSDLFEDSEAFKKTILESYERQLEEKVGLPTLLDLIEDYDSTFNIERFSEELNLICNKNFIKEKVATAVFKIEVPVPESEEESEEEVQVKKIKVPVYLIETEFTKLLKYEGIVEGIDLTLDFSSLIGSFIYSRTAKEVDSFKFKFKNKYLEITKLKELTEFLEEEEIRLPKNFEKELRRSLKSLDKSIVKPKEIHEENLTPVEEDLPEDVLTFGVNENSYYMQSAGKGIEFKIVTDKGIISKPVANVVIEDVEIILDSLEILEPVYNVTYYNKTFNKKTTVEYLTKKQLTEEFIKANVFYISTKENVEAVLNAFVIDGTKEGTITTKTEAYLEGYFIINNHVVSNSRLNNIKKPTKEELAEAITLLNEIMKGRTEEGLANDSSVYRFSLWNPFSYCLKQLGYGKGNYSLILIGASQTNKTGASKIGNLFYNRTEEETTGSTVSVLGSKLGENSFSSIFDECSHLFNIPEALNVMKRAIYEKTGRAVKDRNDNSKIDNFTAFNLPLFLLNEPTKFKDFITNRYKIIYYSSESYVTNSAKEKFNEKYVPDSEDTILKKLAVIGKCFSEKLIAIIEDPTERSKLFNMEETTIEILKQIQEEAGVKFNKAMLETTESSTKYNYDVKTEIKELLNNEFKTKNKITANNSPSGFTFTQSVINNDFDFITYNKNRTEKTAEKEFIINTSKLKDYVNKNVEEFVELTTILEALDLTETIKAKPDYKEPYEDYIKKNHKIRIKEPSGKVKERTISGIYLTLEELANKLFSFNIDFSKNDSKPTLNYKVEKVESEK